MIDFDYLKINIRRNTKVNKNKFMYEILNYTILKILKNIIESIKTHTFEANVYSFAMTYFKILSKNDRFDSVKKKDEIY